MANLTVYTFSTSFAVLFKCWKASPDDRPTFEALSTTFGSLLDSAPGYMDNSIMVLEPEGKLARHVSTMHFTEPMIALFTNPDSIHFRS